MSRIPYRKHTLPTCVTSGFTSVDQLTGCNGIPVGHITLITGEQTIGKLTLGSRTLANAQGVKTGEDEKPVGVLDFERKYSKDILATLGLDIDNTLLVDGPLNERAVEFLYSLICGYGLRAVLVNGFGSLLGNGLVRKAFHSSQYKLLDAISDMRCIVIFLDELQLSQPFYRSRSADSVISRIAAVHVDLRNERRSVDRFCSHILAAEAHLIRSRWNKSSKCHIDFSTYQYQLFESKTQTVDLISASNIPPRQPSLEDID